MITNMGPAAWVPRDVNSRSPAPDAAGSAREGRHHHVDGLGPRADIAHYLELDDGLEPGDDN